MKIEMENIGGLKGKIVFEVKKGITNLIAQNTAGKTSIVRGLQAVFADANPREVMNITKNEAIIKILNGDYSTELKYYKLSPTEAEVKGNYPKYKEPRASLISFALPESKVIHNLTLGEGNLEEFLSEVGRANEYKKLRTEVKEKLVKQKTMLDTLRKEAKQIPGLNERKARLEEAIKQLKKQLEETTVTAEAKALQEQINKLEDKKTEASKNIGGLERDIEIKSEKITEKGNTIQDYEKRLKRLKEKLSRIDGIRAELEKKSEEATNKMTHEIKPRLDVVQSDKSKMEQQLKKIGTGKEKAGLCPFDKQTCERYTTEIIQIQLNGSKEQIAELQKWYNEVQKEYQKYVHELMEIENEKLQEIILNRDIDQEHANIRQLNKEIDETKHKIEKLREALGVIEKERKILESEIGKIGEVKEDKRTSIESEINKKNKELLDIESQINDISKQFDDTKSVIDLEKEWEGEIENLEKTHEDYDKIYKRQLHGVRDEFNKKVGNMLKKLGFDQNFHSVFIDEHNTLTVYKTEIDSQPINTLSTSERYSLAILIMLTARETYIPEFPLFVLDEILVSFDPVRETKILEYIKGEVPFVICTKLGDVGKEIKVTYS